jgi:hypothetical protein
MNHDTLKTSFLLKDTLRTRSLTKETIFLNFNSIYFAQQKTLQIRITKGHITLIPSVNIK